MRQATVVAAVQAAAAKSPREHAGQSPARAVEATEGCSAVEGLDMTAPDLYEVEFVSKHRKRRGKLEFRVRWKGYTEAVRFWE